MDNISESQSTATLIIITTEEELVVICKRCTSIAKAIIKYDPGHILLHDIIHASNIHEDTYHTLGENKYK